MIEYLVSHIGEIASLFAVLITILSAIFWSHKKLHNGFTEVNNSHLKEKAFS